MSPEADFPIIEAVGMQQTQNPLTEAQQDRLKGLDWFIEELGVVMKENKEYGVLQADWRHQERSNKWLME
mgnify:CR=1 FL=1